MSAPYLEELEQAFADGARDLHQAAKMIGISFESACLSFNNGLLKNYFKILLTGHDHCKNCVHWGTSTDRYDPKPQGDFRNCAKIEQLQELTRVDDPYCGVESVHKDFGCCFFEREVAVHDAVQAKKEPPADKAGGGK